MIWYDNKIGLVLVLFIIGSTAAFVVATEKNKWDERELECISKKGYYLRTRDAHVCIEKNIIIKLKGEQ